MLVQSLHQSEAFSHSKNILANSKSHKGRGQCKSHVVKFQKNPANNTINKNLKSRELEKCKPNKTTAIRVFTENIGIQQTVRKLNVTKYRIDAPNVHKRISRNYRVDHSQSRKKSLTYKLTKKSRNSRVTVEQATKKSNTVGKGDEKKSRKQNTRGHKFVVWKIVSCSQSPNYHRSIKRKNAGN